MTRQAHHLHLHRPALFSDPRGVALLCVFASVAIDFLGMAIVIPTLPTHVIALGGTSRDFGYLLSAYSVASVVSGFWMPWFADRYGCRKGFLISLFGSSVGMLLQGLASDFYTFLAFRFLAGMFSGSAGMAMAYISQVCVPAERPKYFPYVGTIIMTAFALGPGFGAGLSSLTSDAMFKGQLPMFCASALAASALLLAHSKLLSPEDLKARQALLLGGGAGGRDEAADATKKAGGSDGAAATAATQTEVRPADSHKRLKVMVLMGLVSFLKSTNYNVFPSTFGYLIADQYGLDSAFFAFAFTASGIVVILNNLVLFAFLRSRLPPLAIGVLGAVVCAAGTLFIPHMPNYGSAMAFLMVMMIGNGLIENVIPIILSDQASAKNAARVLAIGTQCAWAGHIGGPVLYSAVIDTSGYDQAYLIAAAFAAASGVSFVVVRALQRRKADAPLIAEHGADGTGLELVEAGRGNRTLDGGSADNAAATVPDALLDALREDLRKILAERHYAEALDTARHSEQEVAAASELVRELVALALPPLPAGKGLEHIRAFNEAKKLAEARPRAISNQTGLH